MEAWKIELIKKHPWIEDYIQYVVLDNGKPRWMTKEEVNAHR